MDKEQKHLDLVVRPDDQGYRFDVWLQRNVHGHSRAEIQKAIKLSTVLVNSKVAKASLLLHAGDSVKGSIASEIRRLKPVDIDLKVLFEDDDILVVDKPAGISVHPGAGPYEVTLVEGILHHLSGRLTMAGGDPLRPGIVHRLDKDTSGSLVCAKSDAAFHGLSAQFAKKSNSRQYLAILNGVLDPIKIERTSHLLRDPHNRLRFHSIKSIDTELGQGQGKFARSFFSLKRNYANRLSLVSVRLDTGRTHQIRVHAKDLGCHIIGDFLYGGPCVLPSHFSQNVQAAFKNVKRQMLHASKLGFEHPLSREWLEFEAPLPDDFVHLTKLLDPYELDLG